MNGRTGDLYWHGSRQGSLIEYLDGTVDNRRNVELMPAFRLGVRDVVVFSVRPGCPIRREPLRS